jgi:hypothetical protein
MPVPIRTLKVRPNPWIEIDSRGLPCGRVPYEQPQGGFDPRSVGAEISNVVKVQDAPALMLGQAIHTFEVKHAEEDVLVPNTGYYRRRIMKGELIAADKPTYVAATGSVQGFEEQGKFIEQLKVDAIAAFDACNGDGAFRALAEQRAADAKRAEEVSKAAAADQEPKLLKRDEKPAPAAKKGDS